MKKHISSSVFFLACATLLISCGQTKQVALPENAAPQNQGDSGIFGGVEVPTKDEVSPYVVGLKIISAKGNGICTGTVIAEDIVLTAAHCLEGISRVQIYFKNKISKEETLEDGSVKANAFLAHESYIPDPSKSETKDIGLVHFSGGLPSGFKVAKIADSKSLKKGEKLIMTGYGISSRVFKMGSGTLRRTTQTIDYPHENPTEFSVNQLRNGICSGDSGGPGFVKRNGELQIAGVTSRGAGVVYDCIGEATYTKVDAYIEWIRESIEKLRTQNKASEKNDLEIQEWLDLISKGQ